jgi:hypothetical protein
MQNASLVRFSATRSAAKLCCRVKPTTISATALSSITVVTARTLGPHDSYANRAAKLCCRVKPTTISATALSSITVVTARTLGPHDGLDSVCDG